MFVLPFCMTAFAQNKIVTATSGNTVKEVKTSDKSKPNLPYDEKINAMEQLENALAEANATNRYVLAQVGGNWCPWCVRFAQFADTNAAVHELFEKNFVYIHINYSKANKNLDVMKRLGNPGRFGYPVFVILDRSGQVLHIQNSAYLEEGKGYSEKKVVDCFSNWTEKAIMTYN